MFKKDRFYANEIKNSDNEFYSVILKNKADASMIRVDMMSVKSSVNSGTVLVLSNYHKQM